MTFQKSPFRVPEGHKVVIRSQSDFGNPTTITHEIRTMPDGRIYCTCDAWQLAKTTRRSPRWCSHLQGLWDAKYLDRSWWTAQEKLWKGVELDGADRWTLLDKGFEVVMEGGERFASMAQWRASARVEK